VVAGWIGSHRRVVVLAGVPAVWIAAACLLTTLVGERRSFWKSCTGVDAPEVADRIGSVLCRISARTAAWLTVAA
jgi:hypothetical protein